jgi:hypothetical protein
MGCRRQKALELHPLFSAGRGADAIATELPRGACRPARRYGPTRRAEATRWTHHHDGPVYLSLARDPLPALPAEGCASAGFGCCATGTASCWSRPARSPEPIVARTPLGGSPIPPRSPRPWPSWSHRRRPTRPVRFSWSMAGLLCRGLPAAPPSGPERSGADEARLDHALKCCLHAELHEPLTRATHS